MQPILAQSGSPGCEVHIARRSRLAFTLIELLVGIAIIAILAALLLPALSRAKAQAYTVKCTNSLKQLSIVWQAYSCDNSEQLVPNGHGLDQKTWVVGDDHNQPSAFADTKYLLNPQYALFANYLQTAEIYRCPADRSTRMVNGARVTRVRNYALNSYMNWQYGWLNNNDPNYWLFCKSTDVAAQHPSDLFTFIDTSPVSVCMPAFEVPMDSHYFFHRPSVEHNSGCPVAFADGHVEKHRWLNPQTVALAHTSSTSGPSPDANWQDSEGQPDGDHLRMGAYGANQDLTWLQQHASSPR